MVYAYMRQIPNVSQYVEQQRAILTFALKKELLIDKEVIEYSTKNLSIDERTEFENFLQSMQEEDIVLVSCIEMLSDKAEELIKVINCLLSHGANLWLVEANVLLNKETSMVDIFPLLNLLRQEEKEKSNHRGRPKGSKSSSKFDVYQSQILHLLEEGLSVSAIARELEVSRSSLKDYIESRGIKELLKGTWLEMKSSDENSSMENKVLICPFEQAKILNEKKVS